MRIGIVTGEYPPMLGGVGAFTHVLARSLAAQGQDVRVFSTSTASSPDANIPLTNIVTHWNLSSLFAVRRWAAEQSLDVVNLQFQTAAYAMSPFIHFLPDVVRNVPVITTFHDLRYPYLFPKAGPLRNWIVRHLTSASDGVIVTNAEDFTRVEPFANAQIIPIGSNIIAPLPQDYDAAKWRAKAGAQPADFLIAHFGFLKKGKGLETLLESVAAFHRAGLPIRVLMIGGRTSTNEPTDAAYSAEVDARIDALGIAPLLHWTGYVDDRSVGAFLTASDVVVLPFSEGASYRSGSLMAALTYGCAIVTTTPRTATLAFIDTKNMLLFPPNDSTALTQRLQRLYDSPEVRQQLRQGAKQLAHQFDWSQIAKDTIAFFERIKATR